MGTIREEPKGGVMDRRLARTGALVVALAIALSGDVAHADKGGEPGSNGKGGKNVDHCISPSGTDINELWGVDDRVVMPFCQEALTGERLTVSSPWLMAATFEEAPEGFVPDGDTPLEDFINKFAGVRYVIDPGTDRERSYLLDNVSDLAVREFDGLPLVNSITMGSLHPLRAGEHSIEVYWIFDAQHCDGIDPSEFNCLPAGETLYHAFSFEVLPRN
jgi:hypothetical protein